MNDFDETKSLAYEPKLKVVMFLLSIWDIVGAGRALLTHPWRGNK